MDALVSRSVVVLSRSSLATVARGWEREWHACPAPRVEQLLAEPGDPLTEEPNDQVP